MKFLQKILILLAMTALLMPCLHAKPHHPVGEDQNCATGCLFEGVPSHADCHACSETPCLGKLTTSIGARALFVTAPVRPVLFTRVSPSQSVRPLTVLPLPPRHLVALQTIQLLI